LAGVEQKIPPLSIAEGHFDAKVADLRADRANTRARSLTRILSNYERLSQRVKEILADEWDAS